jgi:stress response protein SCP2
VELVRGQKVKLSDISTGTRISVRVEVSGPTVDVACFGLDAAGKLSDDRYMIFFNQPSSPDSEVRWSQASGRISFDIDLEKLPTTIDRLCFTAAVDGLGTLAEISSSSLAIVDGATQATFRFSGADFAREKAVMLADIYRKDAIWRVNAVGQGFDARYSCNGIDAHATSNRRHIGQSGKERSSGLTREADAAARAQAVVAFQAGIGVAGEAWPRTSYRQGRARTRHLGVDDTYV